MVILMSILFVFLRQFDFISTATFLGDFAIVIEGDNNSYIKPTGVPVALVYNRHGEYIGVHMMPAKRRTENRRWSVSSIIIDIDNKIHINQVNYNVLNKEGIVVYQYPNYSVAFFHRTFSCDLFDLVLRVDPYPLKYYFFNTEASQLFDHKLFMNLFGIRLSFSFSDRKFEFSLWS